MFEEDLRSRIADAAAGKVANASIAWGDRPQESALPGISIDLIDDRREQHMTDFQALRGTQVQVDIWSTDREEARDLRELVITGIVGPLVVGSTDFRRSFVDRLASTFERTDTGIIYRQRIDFSVWHAAAS